jgi:hypothetical protein
LGDQIEDVIGGHVTLVGKRRSVYRALVGKHEGKRPLGRPRHGWEDNIKMLWKHEMDLSG